MHWLSITTALAGAQSVLSHDLSRLSRSSSRLDSLIDSPSYRSRLLELHKSLVSISSTSGQEGDVGSFLADYLFERGYSTAIQYIKPRDNTPEDERRFNIVAWHGEKEAPRARVLVTSHIDVVPPHIEYGIEDGEVTSNTRIWGRGSVDAKGSVAAMVTATEELLRKEEVNDDDVLLLFVVGEEVAGDGMKAFSDSMERMDKSHKFEAAIFGEPTENKLACGHKGGLFCDIRAKGVGGHSGYPWLGKSANELMIRALSKILDADLGSSERYGNTTVNIGRFDGGVASNVIPEDAFVGMAVRVAIGPEKTGGEVIEEKMKNILNDVDKDAFEFTCSNGYGFVACDCDVDGKSLSASMKHTGG